MGQLVRGVWKDEWYDTDAHGGEFMRDTARFRNWVTADGTPGPTGGVALPQKADDITFMCPMPAPGRIAP